MTVLLLNELVSPRKCGVVELQCRLDDYKATISQSFLVEIKVETQARAERGAYPLGGIDPADAREALSKITTRDRDDWARGWSAVADRYHQV